MESIMEAKQCVNEELRKAERALESDFERYREAVTQVQRERERLWLVSVMAGLGAAVAFGAYFGSVLGLCFHYAQTMWFESWAGGPIRVDCVPPEFDTTDLTLADQRIMRMNKILLRESVRALAACDPRFHPAPESPILRYLDV